MPKLKISMLNKLVVCFSLAATALSVLSSLSIPTFAQRIGVKPFTESGQASRSVFRYQADPGQTINDAVVVTNQSNFDGTASVLAKDITTDTSGALTFIPTDQENKGPATWVKLVENNISVPAEKAVKIPFSVTIPNNIPAGEYAAGIVVSPTSNQQTEGGASVQVRMGTTIYITIKGDLKLDNNVSDVSIVNPTQEFFPEEIDARDFITPDNMVIKFRGVNEGNIYSKIEGVVKITLESGEVKEVPIKRTLNLDSNYELYYINTSLPYTVGKTKLTFEFDSQPYNFDNLPFNKSDRSKGALEYEFSLTPEDLDKFKTARDGLDAKRKEEFNNAGKPQTFDVNEETQVLPQTGGNEQNWMPIVFGLSGLFLLLLVLLVIFLIVLAKKKKEKEDEEDKKKDSKK